jgi:hypothetical protein
MNLGYSAWVVRTRVEVLWGASVSPLSAPFASVTEIIASNAQLPNCPTCRKQWTWISDDETLIGEGHPVPGGQVARLLGILE